MPDWAKDPDMQKRTWDVIARELDGVERHCVTKMLECVA
jgi:hypothetical protein